MNLQPYYASIQAALLALAAGLAMLIAGGELLVSGAVKLAARWGMAPLLIGLTIVAFGTSMPELFVGLLALVRGHPDILIGNVVGSNIANIGLILGIAATIAPLQVSLRTVRTELYLVLAATAALGLIAWHGIFPRPLGALFIGCLVCYTAVSYRRAALSRNRTSPFPSSSSSSAEQTASPDPVSSSFYLFIFCAIGGGLLLLVYGSDFFINGAVDVARFAGVSELVIGLTLAAVGTSLPELASTLAAIRQRQSDLLVGNIIGSNLFNVLMVMGCGAVFKPFSLSMDLLYRDLPVMFGFSAILIPILAVRRGVSRWHGLAILIAYGVYIRILM